MTPEHHHEQFKMTREVCLANAEAFLAVAERQLGNGADHVCFHLALLALEEVGKSTLATIHYSTKSAGFEKENLLRAMDDHVKKIFWALWGGGLVRNEQFTKQSIEENLDFASTLHDQRLEMLYTNPENPLPVGERVEEGRARTLMELARARLELEKTTEIAEFEAAHVEDLTWFFSSLEDPERRQQLLSRNSLNKLEEVGSGREWIKWLRELFRKHEEEMRQLAEKELRREKPEGEEADAPKYRMRIRIQSPSHSIRNNAFAEWNERVRGIKIYKSDRKDATKLAKGEMLIELILPKILHTSYVWEHGLFMAKTVVVAFNIGTLGVFWWHAHKDAHIYYEEIVDLEKDPKGKIKLVVSPHKRLHVGFDEAKLALDQNAVQGVYHIMALLLREAKMLEDFLRAYAMGLTCFSKTDIHLRLEVNAFEEFYKALKGAMRAFGDWDGDSDFKEAVLKQYEKIGEMKDLEKTLDLGYALEADTKRENHHPITLTEVLAMKLYCDYYIHLKARGYFEELKAKAELESTPVEGGKRK